MPVILSFCSARFVLHRRLTLFALRLPFQMRFHWLDAHLLFSGAISISRSVTAVEWQVGTPSATRWQTMNFTSDLSFARRGDLQVRVSHNLAVPSLSFLTICAESCKS